MRLPLSATAQLAAERELVHVARSVAVRKTRTPWDHDEAEEWAGDIGLGIARALRTWDPARTKLVTWIGEKVFSTVQEGRRTRHHLSRWHQDALKTREPEPHELPASSLDVPIAGDDGQIEFLAEILPGAADTERDALEALVSEALLRCVRRLPVRERAIIAAYYWGGMTLAAIAPLLGVCETRVFQLRAQALRRLREWLAE